ncbi:hypothetical protein D3C74_404000 [compost metagenome]
MDRLQIGIVDIDDAGKIIIPLIHTMEEGDRGNNRHGYRKHDPQEDGPVIRSVNPCSLLQPLGNLPEEGHEDNEIEEAEHYRNDIDQEIIQQMQVPVQQKGRDQSTVEE